MLRAAGREARLAAALAQLTALRVDTERLLHVPRRAAAPATAAAAAVDEDADAAAATAVDHDGDAEGAAAGVAARDARRIDCAARLPSVLGAAIAAVAASRATSDEVAHALSTGDAWADADGALASVPAESALAGPLRELRAAAVARRAAAVGEVSGAEAAMTRLLQGADTEDPAGVDALLAARRDGLTKALDAHTVAAVAASVEAKVPREALLAMQRHRADDARRVGALEEEVEAAAAALTHVHERAVAAALAFASNSAAAAAKADAVVAAAETVLESDCALKKLRAAARKQPLLAGAVAAAEASYAAAVSQRDALWAASKEPLKKFFPEHYAATVESLEDFTTGDGATEPKAAASGGTATECKICFDAEWGVMLVPCRHVCVCRGCAEQLLRCPVCRAAVQAREAVFPS